MRSKVSKQTFVNTAIKQTYTEREKAKITFENHNPTYARSKTLYGKTKSHLATKPAKQKANMNVTLQLFHHIM